MKREIEFNTLFGGFYGPDIIAVIWDFDKTLVNGYMQRPIFEEYGVDESVLAGSRQPAS